LLIITDTLCILVYCLYFHICNTFPSKLYTLSLHDALPIFPNGKRKPRPIVCWVSTSEAIARNVHITAMRLVSQPSLSCQQKLQLDRKSTRLNSSHVSMSYAVFCLKKKTENIKKEIQNWLLE